MLPSSPYTPFSHYHQACITAISCWDKTELLRFPDKHSHDCGAEAGAKNMPLLFLSNGSGEKWGGENPGSFHSGLLSGLWTLPWSRHQLPLGAASLVVKCAWIWESPLTTDIYLSASLEVFSQHGDNKIMIQDRSSVCEERNFWYCSAAISPATWKWQTWPISQTLSSELI